MSKQLRLPTLLVITNNPSIRFWIKKHLDEKFFLINAESRSEAVNALNAKLDFIILDGAMEECDALDLCKELAKLTQKGLIPILLITGSLKKSFRNKAMEAGVTEFLTDQLDVEELEEKITEGLKTASTRQRTEDLGLTIKMPKLGGSLKSKTIKKKDQTKSIFPNQEKE